MHLKTVFISFGLVFTKLL